MDMLVETVSEYLTQYRISGASDKEFVEQFSNSVRERLAHYQEELKEANPEPEDEKERLEWDRTMREMVNDHLYRVLLPVPDGD